MSDNSFASIEDLAAAIPDGAMLAMPKDDSGAAVALTRELIRRNVRDLHLLCLPVGGLQADLLIGAGCVATIETSGVSLGEIGFAPRFREAVQTGRVRIVDATCPAIYAGLQAGEKGIPFIPLRGIIGSDILKNRDDWKVIQNPFEQAEDPIVALPAIRPDVTIFHARLADRFGNVWVGNRRECTLLAHASKTALVTAEEIYDGNLMTDERLVGGTIPPLYVEAIAHVANGAWPVGLTARYPRDTEHLRAYVQQAKTEEGFQAYLKEFVFADRAAA